MSSLLRITTGTRFYHGTCRVCSYRTSLPRIYGEPAHSKRLARQSLWTRLARHIRREHPVEIEAAEAQAAKGAPAEASP